MVTSRAGLQSHSQPRALASCFLHIHCPWRLTYPFREQSDNAEPVATQPGGGPGLAAGQREVCPSPPEGAGHMVPGLLSVPASR